MRNQDALSSSKGSVSASAVQLFTPIYKESETMNGGNPSSYVRHIAIFCEMDHSTFESLQSGLTGIECLMLQSPSYLEINQRFQSYAQQFLDLVKTIMEQKVTGEVLIQLVVPVQGEQKLFTGLYGLLRTAHMENPRLSGQLIEIEPDVEASILVQMLNHSKGLAVDIIRFDQGKRWEAGWNEVIVPPVEASIPWKDNGVYLVTGGAGGLGLLFAEDIIRQVNDPVLILTGRSVLSMDKEAKLHEMRATGARIEYKQTDVSLKDQVEPLIHDILEEFGSLHGIIHGAGVVCDNFILKKTGDELEQVLNPKVSGTTYLDSATKDLPLDFFIFFSSIAGCFGNPGQADYAAANAYMDAYAAYRNGLVASGLRQGQSLSINWPYWKDGGMEVDEITEKSMMQSWGMTALDTKTGIQAMHQALASGHDRVLILSGQVDQIRERLLPGPTPKSAASEPTKRHQVDEGLLRDRTGRQLKVLFGEVTRLEVTQLNVNEPLESYGIDSIMINQLNAKMAGIFGELSKTLFYEYQTLGEVLDYLTAEHTERCVRWTGLGEQSEEGSARPSVDPRSGEAFPVLVSFRKEKNRSTRSPIHKPELKSREPIAIIGISGRYPSARNLNEYWENLKAGRDCITEIPDDRWPMEDFFDPDPQEAVAQGKSYSKWGGFLEGFADFDPWFFNISPREAMMMDPQERLFIESCWEALEDAGYTREQLTTKHNRRVGVFAGITKTGYDLYGPGLWEQGEHVNPYTSFSSVANRVSYYLNLQGPSMPIDTMCSSSLTAIHEACEHLHLGECEMAIAGGVNLYLHPSNYHWLSVQQMLSKDGRCKSFGQGANGFVPGEGVGIVLLKPLSRAIADEDQIHAVIRSTSTNHGGKTNGYTVPNPVAQGELVRAALDKAGINARAISYIEAHGTGTDLGDPIEITGLTQAFSKDTRDTGFCSIGSAKSNIGHLEAAAGMAGLTKIVLQMKHKMLVPSLHAKELNPNINFANTPFVVQQSLQVWQKPMIHMDGELIEFPRMAGVSSFGAGGSNAHVILEEYTPEETYRPAPSSQDGLPVVIPLSAKNQPCLNERVKQLLEMMDEEILSDSHLLDMAYTLQVGREGMEERIAVVAESIQDLQAKLTRYLTGHNDIDGLYRGQMKPGKEQQSIEEADSSMEKLVLERNFRSIAMIWVQGLRVDWNTLYRNGVKPRRRSLPVYPFARERYYIAEKQLNNEGVVSSTRKSLVDLADVNESARMEMDGSSKETNHAASHRRAVSGKGRRREMRGMNTKQCIEWDLKEQIGILLQIQKGRLDSEINLADFGFDSISLTHLATRLSKHYGVELTPSVFFGHSTISKITEYLMKEHQEALAEFYYEADEHRPAKIAPQARPIAQAKMKLSSNLSDDAHEPIAVIGMSGRFPEARNVEEMWTILTEGRNAVKEIPADRFDWRHYYSPSDKDPHKTDSKWCGCIPGVSEFDPLFFEISPKDAESMDPRQRLLLQEAWKALEHAGYGDQKIRAGKVGMFVGAEQGDYQQLVRGEAGITSNHNAILAARLSYFLNLNGPVLTVDTACSSGLAAAHQACLSLRNDECDTAIAAGVNLMLTPDPYVGMSQAGMLSRDGTCFAFDKRANGLVPGEAVTVVVLKRLSRAETDGDSILAVIRGSSINYDGKTNGITAPSGVAQTELVKAVYEQSRVNPGDVEYVVTHGTGTRLGDPVEVNALQDAFKAYTDKQGYCAITSNKTNFGHTFAASGLVNMINLIQAFRHETIPASLNFEQENDYIHWTESPFYVNTTNKPWPASGDKKRLGAVSAFGMSGTNVHMVLESYVTASVEEPTGIPPYHLLTFSAKTKEALEEKIQDMVVMLGKADASQESLSKISYTLLEGRQHFNHRMAVVVRDKQDAEYILSANGDTLRLPNRFAGKVPRDFEGQALIQQYVNDLLRSAQSLKEDPEKYREALYAIADLYCQGYEISGDGLYDGALAQLTELPTYPFAREHYWASVQDATAGVPDTKRGRFRIINRSRRDAHHEPYMRQDQLGITEGAAPQETYELMTFEEVWEEEALKDIHNADLKTLVCFLTEEESKKIVTDKATALGGDTQVIFVSRSTVFDKKSRHDYSIPATNRDSYVQALSSILEDFKEIDAVLYLWPIEDAAYIKDYSSIVHLVQAIAAAKLKPKQLLLAGQFENPIERCYMESWIGFERSLGLVLPNVSVSVVSIELQARLRKESLIVPIGKLWKELQANQSGSVLYQDGKRYICRVKPTMLQIDSIMLKRGRTYLITGGCGGLGLLFARHIASRYAANLILTGRSPMNDEIRAGIKELEDLGSQVLYVQSDICDVEHMREGLVAAKARFGPIHGVIHAAGMSSRQNILEKELEDFHAVLAPKVEGTLALDEILQDEQQLEFICYFSSTSAVIGDFGSCDYAIGNRYQMAYARHRNEQNRAGRIVINWPLWKEGGMGFQDQDNTEMYLKSSGQRLLETEEGLQVFERILSHSLPQHLVLVGQRSRVHRFLGLANNENSLEVNRQTPITINANAAPGKGWRNEMKGLSLAQCLEWDMKEIVSELLKIPRDKLDLDENLAEFGFDSINLAQFANVLTEHYGLDITPSLFFGQSTIGKLIDYFLKEHNEMTTEFYRESQISDTESPNHPDTAAAEPKAFKRARVQERIASSSSNLQEPIAIIGMSGRFPEARNIDEMWTILAEGQSAVSEVPAERFDWRRYYGDGEQESTSIHCKWCGTIPGVREFDPMFFEISPNEAKTMDPRQRLLLQESWRALEDAGYGEDKLGGCKIGMFVGVEDGDYHLLVKDKGSITSNHNAILAARLSYFLNLTGPNMAINTACSSGLVAAHQACMSLRNGECDAAIVAGVNLLLTPNAYAGISQAGILSADGKCYAFDQRANGTVPGEAVSALVFKRLSQAEADGDPIHAVIRGSGINYDGRTNGITAPSGIAQTNLLKEVYHQYQINPAEIEYIVTHGTGTKLGDPVEINALNEAFKAHTEKQGYCALTSSKTNFGHTFAASGLVSLINLVMSMRHEMIPPSLHFEQENDYIQWADSPFYVNKKAKAWSQANGASLKGAVSAFGMSGTNAHMVVESYSRKKDAVSTKRPPYYVLALSAKTKEALEEKIRDMLHALVNEKWGEEDLQHISYTLLNGRVHFSYRCAVVIQDLSDAVYVMKQAGNREKVPNLFEGRVPRDFTGQKAMQLYIQELLAKCRIQHLGKSQFQETLYALADFYCQGYEIEWGQLFGHVRPYKVNLPTYPFERESYWVNTAEAEFDEPTIRRIDDAGPHPAVEAEVSPLTDRTYDGEIKADVEIPHHSSEMDSESLVSAVSAQLRTLLMEVTGIPHDKLENAASFEELGLDSLMIHALNKKIELWVGQLDATLFYTYNSIQALAAYLAQEYNVAVSKHVDTAVNGASLKNLKQVEQVGPAPKQPPQAPNPAAIPSSRSILLMDRQPNVSTDIAIIGLAGRYPKADTLQQFWNNLYAGKDSIEEIPASRWSLDGFYEPDRSKAVAKGLSYSKWGGFLDRIEYFDPLFFNISPRDAMYMDPQERLFLEVAWGCMENAGYTRESLKRDGYGNQIGVFVGATFNNYQLFMADAAGQANKEMYLATSQMFSIANRVSYIMDFTGPSLTVDTACSSSLYAVHLACESIRNGQSRMAIAGGVNLSLHPSKYITLCQGQFSASDGRCRAFGEGGTGYVPSEAVGAVFLKPLQEAIKDQDSIYGVIKGTAVSHAGRTNGYTVPSPVSQSQAIEKALIQSGIDPRSISSIEAHGTGTSLGDPIEIKGLTDVFGKYTGDTGYCSISSVKSNIGHAEAAAGIAQLTKVLLQLKHQTLVKNVMHGHGLNPNIDFDRTPFVVQRDTAHWKRPTIHGQEVPRRSGISSFGAGGANAHIIVEEYVPVNDPQARIAVSSQSPALILLSARNEDRLREKARQLLYAITEEQFSDDALPDIAYTLQVGREAMEERLAWIVGSMDDLKMKLEGFIEGRGHIKDMFRGQVKRNKETMSVFEADEEFQEAVIKWIQRGKYAKLLNLWVRGLGVDWNQIYGDVKPCRIGLPTYPFAGEPYWIPEIEKDADATNPVAVPAVSVVHPLLHRNTSDLSGLRFSSVFTGSEFFLKDHVVKGQRVLPGVAYLEMARTAVEQIVGETLEQGRTGIRLKNVVWARPIVAEDQPVQVHLDLYHEDNGEIAYEVYSEQEAGGEPVLHSQGSAEVCSVNDHASLDIESLLTECNRDIISSSKIYETYSAMGIQYGPAHQGIQKVYLGSGQALAKLSLPSSVTDAAAPFTLHPSLMDSALQATISMMMSPDSASTASLKPGLPFALQELEVFGSCPSEMWARIRYSDGNKPESKVQKLDIDLCDALGKVYVKMKGFSTRVLDGEVKSSTVSETPGTLLLEPIWRDQPAARISSAPEYAKHLVFLCEIGSGMEQSLNHPLSQARCITLESYQERIEERFITYSARIFEEIQAILRDKPKDKILIQVLSLSQHDQLLLSGISGLMKAAQSENSKLVCQYIEIESVDSNITDVYMENSQYPMDQRIRYRDGKRWVAGWDELQADAMKVAAPWRDRGIYLITGGAGGLGIIFAKEILHKAKGVVLILTGRSSLHEDTHAELDKLRVLGAKVDYRQVDVTDKQEVTSLIQSIHEEYGSLNGIIHGAGIIRDNLILRKDVKELENVMAPKVRGLVILDEASKDIQLDLFIAFSSVAGATGNPGQADYSAANAFMDAYAEYRNTLTASRQRHGRMLSINWPLWKEGGMRVDEEVEKIMMKSLGTVPMQTSTGIQALYQGFASGRNQVVVMTGIMSRVKPRMLPAAASVQHENMPAPVKSEDTNLVKRVETALVQTVSKLLKVKLVDIDMHSELSEYGFDSISLTQFANHLNEEYHLELTPTVFFEYTTLDSFAEYLLAEHRGAFDVKAALTVEQDISVPKTRGPEEEEIPLRKSRSRPARMAVPPESPSPDLEATDSESEPIAIVGISGLFPMAKDVDEFWKNIVEGKDCITEIPKERWDWRECLDTPSEDEEQTSLKWGGFIEGVEEFDPLFFGISPREAEMMDPQQRLLLTQVWKAVEDAGISPSKLSQHPTGVFVAAGPGDYMNVTSISQGNPQAMTGVVPSLIPNRISYALNLQGPSEYYETACSSTLVALHRAIRSIYNEECEQAIVGAVNLLISPIGFIGFDAMGYLSPDGKAKSFQSNADGFVRSEGVGAIIIKPLSKAIEDNNLIYAVIKGTGVSHGGKGMSLTSPNAAGMKAAMAQAFKGTGVNPRTISYIEAHGIASPIADGIEVNALKTGYQEIASNDPSPSDSSLRKSACYISTLKPSLGHGEVASGMASLIKSIQAIRHKLIPGVKRFTSPSQHISLEGSPLRISAEHHEWEPLTDVHGKVLPRRAAINSYGIGGVNAHVILEEYVPAAAGNHQEPSRKPQIVALSAKSTERLEEYARHMLEYAERAPEFSLSDFAYTLQIGREQMESRLAFVANCREELISGFRQFLKISQVLPMAKDSHPVIFTGETVNSKTKMDSDAVLTLFADNNLNDIALQWTRGGIFPWETLHDAKEVRRMSLPVYPFERRRCWPDLDGDGAKEIHEGQVKRAVSTHRLTETTSVMAETESNVSSRVIEIVSKILGMAPPEMNPDRPLDQYGLDSILLMQLLQQLQNQLAPAMDLVKLQECRTLLDIITMIESLSKVDGSRIISRQGKSEVPGSWPQFPELILLNNGSQGSPVFWFHGGLGGVEMYQKLAQKSERPFYGIQARGWLTDRSPLRGVGAMAAYYAHIIQSVQPNGPYDLGGYSLGGVLAYEVTRQLQELGHSVNSVVMLDSPYGKEFQQGAVSRKTAVLQAVNLALASKNFQEPDTFMQTLIHRNELDLNVQEEELFEQLIKLGNTRGLTKTEEQIMSMIEANIKIQHAYQFDRFSVRPLSEPDAVTCYYFRNKGGLIFGELEPYFSTTEDSSALDHATYWEEWERQFPNLHVMDINPSNHMVLLSEAKSYETIFAFCEELYSEHGMTKEFLHMFKEKTKELHGVKA